MNWMQILQAILSLFFVIGILLITLWLFKYCEQKGLRCKMFNNLKTNKRIHIIEKHSIDIKNQIFLIQVDTTEYVVLITPNGNTVLQQNRLSDTKYNE